MRRTIVNWPLVAGVAQLALAPALHAQSIADRVADVRDGQVRMSFAARAEVCGNGRSMISFGDGRTIWHRHSDDWDQECDHGPVRVVLRISGGEIRDVDTYVAGHWRRPGDDVTDLGPVSALQAADYLVGLAWRLRGDAGRDVILPAMLADGADVYPQLFELARDRSVPSDTRKRAVFWLGQAAGDAVAGELGEIVEDESEDREVREHAIFALSQRPADEGVPALIRVARTNADLRLRKKALFWLGQSGDPRAIALFEEILLEQ